MSRANRSERRLYLQVAITFDDRRQGEIKNCSADASDTIEHLKSEYSEKSPYIKHPKSLVAEAVDNMQADSGFGVLGP